MAKKNRQRRSAPNAGKSSAAQSQNNMWPIVAGVVGVLAVAGIIIFVVSRNNQNADPAAVASNNTIPTNCTPGSGEVITTPSGLKYEDLEICPGVGAKNGDQLTVHYVGTLENGSKFDSSFDRNEPIPVTLGAGGVIPGWEEGLQGMAVGSKRKLIIPPNLGYGSQASGPIPANSTLLFTIQVMSIN